MLFMLQVENEICITDHNIFFFHEIKRINLYCLLNHENESYMYSEFNVPHYIIFIDYRVTRSAPQICICVIL